MSLYLDMWKHVNEMTLPEREEWIKAVIPCTGRQVNFKGMRVIDVDLVEAFEQANATDRKRGSQKLHRL